MAWRDTRGVKPRRQDAHARAPRRGAAAAAKPRKSWMSGAWTRAAADVAVAELLLGAGATAPAPGR
jgi:hypothetical protein